MDALDSWVSDESMKPPTFSVQIVSNVTEPDDDRKDGHLTFDAELRISSELENHQH